MNKEERDKIKAKDFALKKERAYPIHDRAHGANALARVTQHGSPAERTKVRKSVCERYPDLPACKNEKYRNPLG